MTTDPPADPLRLLITAGPTQEPIDAVRYLGNRSSGKVGVAIADRGAELGWDVTLLLGPTHLAPRHGAVRIERFRTATELGGLLERLQGGCDILVMAAAVADYRPRVDPAQLGEKLRRGDRPVAIELEPTGDLLAACAARRADGQVLVGFALEPRERLEASAREKLERKGIDFIVANPLGTMESDTIEALVLGPGGARYSTGGTVEKSAFAAWLLGIVAAAPPRRGGGAPVVEAR